MSTIEPSTGAAGGVAGPDHAARLARATLDGLATHIAVVDERGVILAVNAPWRAFAEANGLAQAPAGCCEGADYLHVCDDAAGRGCDTAKVFAAGLRSVLAGEITRSELEYDCHTPDRERWFLARVTLADETPRTAVVAHEDVTARVLAERLQRESLARYASVIASSTDAIFVNREDRIVLANPACLRLFGAVTEGQILGRSPFDLIHPDFHERVRERIRQMFERWEAAPPAEITVVRLDGEGTAEVEVVAAPFLDQGVRAIHVMMRDVGERKRAAALLLHHEATLREAVAAERSLLRNVLDAIPDLVWLKDPDGVFLACNPAFERLLGVPESELSGRTDYDFVDRELADFYRLNDRRAAEAGAPSVNEEWLTFAADGAHRLHETVKTPMRDPGGRLLGVVGIARDVTEARATAAALAQSEERLRLLIEHAPVALAMFDREMRYLGASRRWRTDYGLGDGDLIGRSQYEIFPEIAEEWKAVHRRGLAGEVVRAEEDRFARADGSVQWLRWEVRPWRDGTGVVAGIVIFTEDVTGRRELERQLHVSQKLEAIGRLAGGVAHDFNNLLTVIAGSGELLARALAPTGPERRLLDDVRDAAERASTLTRQLLAFSRSQVLTPEVLRLDQAVARIESMLRRLIGEDVAFACDLSPDTGHVRVDPGSLEQVILNLAVNARDAMPRGGRLTLASDCVELDEDAARAPAGPPPGRYARLVVADTGCGMSPEVRERAFEPFFTTKPLGTGTGLGLSTVLGIVQQSGGHVEVETAEGQGTRFTLYFPQVAAPQPAAAPSPAAPRDTRGGETLLLVEDEQAIRFLAQMELGSLGYTVLAAADGHEALAVAERTRRIDLLLSDLVMPGMSGRELAETLRASRPDLRVLLMSGYVEDALVRHGVVEAEVAFLHKPFTLTELAEKVREVLDEP